MLYGLFPTFNGFLMIMVAHTLNSLFHIPDSLGLWVVLNKVHDLGVDVLFSDSVVLGQEDGFVLWGFLVGFGGEEDLVEWFVCEEVFAGVYFRALHLWFVYIWQNLLLIAFFRVYFKKFNIWDRGAIRFSTRAMV